MTPTPQQLQKQKNSNLSIGLILVNLVLAIISSAVILKDDRDNLGSLSIVAATVIILLAGYAFTYHGKEYRAGKWLFAIALILGLIWFGLLWYATQLGKAFQH